MPIKSFSEFINAISVTEFWMNSVNILVEYYWKLNNDGICIGFNFWNICYKSELNDSKFYPLFFQEVNAFEGETKTPEFLAINPFHTVPTYVDGDFKLWERYMWLCVWYRFVFLESWLNRSFCSFTTCSLLSSPFTIKISVPGSWY